MNSKKGFTLIELLMVMSIIAILVAIAVPAFYGMREGARRTQVRGDLRTLKIAIETYYQNYNTYPPTTSDQDSDWQSALINAYPRMLSVPLYDPFAQAKGTPYMYKLSSGGGGSTTKNDYYIIYSVGPTSCWSNGSVDPSGNVSVDDGVIWVSNGQTATESY